MARGVLMVLLRCVVPFCCLLRLAEGLARPGCVGVAGCWRWSNLTIFFELFSRCPKRNQGRLSIVHYFDLLLEVYDRIVLQIGRDNIFYNKVVCTGTSEIVASLFQTEDLKLNHDQPPSSVQ